MTVNLVDDYRRLNWQGSTSKSNQYQVFYPGMRGRHRNKGRSKYNSIQRQQQQNQHNTSENLMGGRGRTHALRGRYGVKRRWVTCYICRKIGHYAHQCHHRGNQDQSNYTTT